MSKSKSSAVYPSDDWQARDDFDTLMRAAQIRKDPARFKAAQKVAKERMGAVASIANSPTPKT